MSCITDHSLLYDSQHVTGIYILYTYVQSVILRDSADWNSSGKADSLPHSVSPSAGQLTEIGFSLSDRERTVFPIGKQRSVYIEGSFMRAVAISTSMSLDWVSSEAKLCVLPTNELLSYKLMCLRYTCRYSMPTTVEYIGTSMQVQDIINM